MSECPAVLVTMLMSVRGLGSVRWKEQKAMTPQPSRSKVDDEDECDVSRPESMVMDLGSLTG